MSPRTSALLLAAAMTFSVPVTADAGCTSTSPLPADKRASNVSCDGVHVGMALVIPSMKWGDFECAASFAFKDQFGNRYLTFPGTCFLDYDCLEDTVEEVLPPPLNEIVKSVPTCIVMSESELEPYYKNNGPVVKDLNGRRVGRIAYAVNKDGVDFALVRVDKNLKLDPSMPVYGGPLRGTVAQIAQETYVYSPPRMEGAPNARAGVVTLTGVEEAYIATEGLLSMANGSPVMTTDGGAVGYFTGHISPFGYVTKPIGPAVNRAIGRTRLRLQLMTAPLKK